MEIIEEAGDHKERVFPEEPDEDLDYGEEIVHTDDEEDVEKKRVFVSFLKMDDISISADFIVNVVKVHMMYNKFPVPDFPSYSSINNPFEPMPGKIPSCTFREFVIRVLTFVTRLRGQSYNSESNIHHLCANVIYTIERIEMATHGRIRATKTSICRLFGLAFMLWEKVWYDNYYTLNFYARLFGITPQSLVDLELIFFQIIGWNFEFIGIDYLSDHFDIIYTPFQRVGSL